MKGGSRILAGYSGQDATVSVILSFFSLLTCSYLNSLKEVFNAFHKDMDKANKYRKLYHIGKLNPTEAFSDQFAINNSIRQDFAKLRQLAFEMVGYQRLFNLYSINYSLI